MTSGSTKRGRGRPLTGCPKWNPAAQRWEARVSLRDGSRRIVPLPNIAQSDEAQALAMARLVAKRAQDATAVPIEVGEVFSEWSERWLDERETRGLTSVHSDRSRVRHHVHPSLGPLGMRAITRSQIESLVESLDSKVRAGEMSWKNAANAWGLVVKMFDDACHSKRRDLRMREDDPTTGVRGPDRGARKSKQYLYPSEFLALVSDGALPLRWRRLYALAVYTCARAGELDALTWNDVDLEHGVIHINKAVDRHTGKVKSTKTGETRRIPIEPAIAGLIEALKATATDERCFVMPPDQVRAVTLRRHLERAGVKRTELFSSNATRKQITFHDLRATGITWMAVRGDEPLRIKQRAGHSSFSTTEGYIREAENLSAGFGEVFPKLPPELVERSEGILVSFLASTPLPQPNSQRREGDSNPDEKRDETALNVVDCDEGAERTATESNDSLPPKPELDVVESALANALTEATKAGRWDVVAELARQLEARRVARAPNVVPLASRWRR